LTPGSDVYGAINLASVATANLPREVLVSMAAKGTISPIMLHNLYNLEDEDLERFIAIPPRTGIRILDERLKSTGAINMDSLWMAAYGKQLQQGGLTVLRTHPYAAIKRVRYNITRYFLPADVGWPFDGTERQDRKVLSPLLNAFDLVVTGNRPGHNHAFISYFTIPFLLWFGLRRSVGWLKRLIRRHNSTAGDLTIAFAFGNIAYLTAVAILLAQGDQNRIMFEVFPLFTILLGPLVAFVTWRLRVSRSQGFMRDRQSSSVA
jgi:hypothetical protein